MGRWFPQSTNSNNWSIMIDSTLTSVDLTKRCKTISEEQTMNLKKQLNFYLTARGMTAAELSRKSGVSKQVLSLWSSGAKPKNVEQVKKVADVFNVTLDNFLFGIGEDISSAKTNEISALFGEEWVSGVFEVKFRRIKK